MRTKEKWLYLFKDANLDLNTVEPRLPKQALEIANILKFKGTLRRPDLLTEMQSRVKTKQRGGANRILAYYQGLLLRKNVIELRKRPE
tara:strand:+ start:2856 stop:3119 length:264 start_codon:yes stop_codon:yes gene_type:complete